MARRSSEERNAEVRANLRPLAPGERPPALLVAVGLAVALALSNIVLLLTGHAGRPGPLVVYCVLAFGCALGMWLRKYGAILAFECVLGIAIALGFLFLLRASTVADLLICFALIVPPGWLFWKLIRVLARVQAPPGPPHDPAPDRT